MKFQVKIHLNFQVKFQVNMEAQVGQLHMKFQVKFHSKFHMKLALQSFRMIVSLLMLFDPSISASPLLPAGVGVWAIRDPYHMQISVV